MSGPLHEVLLGSMNVKPVAPARLWVGPDGVVGSPEVLWPLFRPGFLALHPRLPVVYVSVDAPADVQMPSRLIALRLLPEGQAELLGEEYFPGPGAAHLSVHPDGYTVWGASYRGAYFVGFPLNEAGKPGAAAAPFRVTGSGPHPERQREPHPHAILPAPGGRFVIGTDLGTDRLHIFRPQAQAGLEEVQAVPATPGCGPRHVAFSPSGAWLAMLSELDGYLNLYRWDGAAGSLTEGARLSILPEGYTGHRQSSEVAFHPSGRFLYAADRGNNSLAVVAFDEASGAAELREVVSCGGEWPRHFGLSPDGQWLLMANQRSHNLQLFRLDATTGHPRPLGSPVPLEGASCVVWRP